MGTERVIRRIHKETRKGVKAGIPLRWVLCTHWGYW